MFSRTHSGTKHGTGRKASTRTPWKGSGQIRPGEDRGWQTVAPSAVPFAEGENPPVAAAPSPSPQNALGPVDIYRGFQRGGFHSRLRKWRPCGRHRILRGESAFGFRGPACASWMAIGMSEYRRTVSTTLPSAFSVLADQRPRSSGLILPSGNTAVASMIRSPAPESARLPSG